MKFRKGFVFKVKTRRWMALWIAALSLFAPLQTVPAQRLLDRQAEWETLDHCQLLKKYGNDGDSFHVEHEGREYTFRLYFVDTPEANDHYPDRVRRQSAYFKISANASVELGAAASKFTDELLKQGCTILTRWENARGNDDLPRFYAVVRVAGKDLAEALIENGYACRYGAPASYPGGQPAEEYRHHLRALEEVARTAGRGGWSGQAQTNHVPEPATTAETGD